MHRFFIFAVAAVLLTVAGATHGRAQEPDFLALGAGVYDVNDDRTSAAARVEYRFSEAHKFWKFTPFVGLMVTGEGGTYGYGGIGLDLFFGNRWVLTPNFAAGLYGRGSGKDLGHPVEFRSGLELAYRFDDYSRLGLTLHHISNAGLGERNPGTESVMLVYSLPFDRLFAD